jgi:hypothetical protein
LQRSTWGGSSEKNTDTGKHDAHDSDPYGNENTPKDHITDTGPLADFYSGIVCVTPPIFTVFAMWIRFTTLVTPFLVTVQIVGSRHIGGGARSPVAIGDTGVVPVLLGSLMNEGAGRKNIRDGSGLLGVIVLHVLGEGERRRSG